MLKKRNWIGVDSDDGKKETYDNAIPGRRSL